MKSQNNVKNTVTVGCRSWRMVTCSVTECAMLERLLAERSEMESFLAERAIAG